MANPRHVTETPLLPGDAGTVQTVQAMRAMVEAAKADPHVRNAVLAALQGAPERSGRAELGALLSWVRDRMRFLRDPVDVEFLQSPSVLLESIRRTGEAWGDCDDLATLYATLAEAAGYPTRFVVQGPEAGDFTHVLVEVDAEGRWLAVDPSQRREGIGWRPRAGIGREAKEMRGLGQIDLEPTAEGGDFWSGLTDFFEVLGGTAKQALPILERYGVAKPIVGYTPTGAPIYPSATLPVGGAPGLAYQTLTQAGPLGLSTGTWLLIGAGAIVLLVLARR